MKLLTINKKVEPKVLLVLADSNSVVRTEKDEAGAFQKILDEER